MSTTELKRTMTDYEAMQKARLKWVRELGRHTNQPCPDERALAAYARGFFDALSFALDIVIDDMTPAAGEKK